MYKYTVYQATVKNHGEMEVLSIAGKKRYIVLNLANLSISYHLKGAKKDADYGLEPQCITLGDVILEADSEKELIQLCDMYQLIS